MDQIARAGRRGRCQVKRRQCDRIGPDACGQRGDKDRRRGHEGPGVRFLGVTVHCDFKGAVMHRRGASH